MRRSIVFILFLSFTSSMAIGRNLFNDTTYPRINQPCPGFVLRNIRYYQKTQADLKEFRGKWLVLDFWYTDCAGCVASFPHVSQLQRQFANQVQFMFVGIPDRKRIIEAMYARYKEEERLVVPCAFDSALAERFEIEAAPCIIVIDPEGIVRGITVSLDSSDVRGFLNGTPPRLHKDYRAYEDGDDIHMTPFDRNRAFLVDGNGGTDSAYLFRSILSSYDLFSQNVYRPETISQDSTQGRFQLLGANLEMLYNYAFYGKMFPTDGFERRPLLEIRDKDIFHSNASKGWHYFCYSMQMPVKQCNSVKIQITIQKDLENYFGFTAAIEERPFPVWRLVSKPGAKDKLKTRGGETKFKSLIPKADFTAQNWPWVEFVKLLQGSTEQKIIDETGIAGNIDIQMTSVFLDIESVRRGLRKWGLDLVPSTEVHKGLVIRDKTW